MKYKQKKPIVYCAMSGDIIHHGHINILKIANSYGYVVLGILTNKAISEYKDTPVTTFRHRKLVFESVKYVNKIIPQRTHDYTYNLKKLKPKYVIHGNDWKKGSQKSVRKKVINVLKLWNGRLIEPKYTKKISSTILKNKIKKKK
tara:strand:+ start:734 stop:1168 length:435 start_codon:yes stop_codon:yes gene_type:complete